MRLSLREKGSVYHELGQFLRAGTGFSQALDSLLAETPRGSVREFFERLRTAARRGDTVPEAFAHARPAVGEMELAVIEAASRGGRLDAAFTYLTGYFENLERVRGELMRGASWPLVQLHLGVLVPALPILLTPGGGTAAYVQQTSGFLLVLYAAAMVLWGVGTAWARGAARLPAAEAALRGTPLFGRLQANLALSRFCSAYEMGLAAGVNVPESLRAAARASRSAGIGRAVEAALPGVRAGEQVGPLLAASGAFPKALLRSMRMGEETGRLDEELRRQADFYGQAAVASLQALGRWLPKVIYGVVGAFLAYQIIRLFSQTMQGYQQFME